MIPFELAELGGQVSLPHFFAGVVEGNEFAGLEKGVDEIRIDKRRGSTAGHIVTDGNFLCGGRSCFQRCLPDFRS